MIKLDTSSNLLIIGCGGHSKVVTEIAETLGFASISYLDNKFDSYSFRNKNVFKNINESYDEYFFVAIGDNYVRKKLYESFLETNRSAKQCPPLIHKSSYISPSVEVSSGTVIMPNVVINCDSKIGKGVIVNTSSVIEHDCYLDDFSSVAPGVNIGGNTKIGKSSAISIGSTVIHNIKIGSNSVVGASSLVLNDIPNQTLHYGTPAHYVRDRVIDEKYL